MWQPEFLVLFGSGEVVMFMTIHCQMVFSECKHILFICNVINCHPRLLLINVRSVRIISYDWSIGVMTVLS